MLAHNFHGIYKPRNTHPFIFHNHRFFHLESRILLSQLTLPGFTVISQALFFHANIVLILLTISG